MTAHLEAASPKLQSFWPWLAVVAALNACEANHAGPAAESSATIVVPGEVNHEAVHAFEMARGRKPLREDLLVIHRTWIDNEVLYREGKKVRAADEAGSREPVIARALAAIDEKVRSTAVTDEELRRWFESHRERFEQPARFDFEDATPSGQSSEASIRAVVEQRNGAPAAARAGVRSFQNRPESNLVQSYGPEVSSALSQAEPGRWLALRARDGWRAMRVLAWKPAIRAVFETQREAIRRDWVNAAVAKDRSAAVRALWQNYEIEFDDTFRCPADQ